MTVELNKAERDLPPKSDKRAPLMATTGCPEPSNFSAWRRKNRKDVKLGKRKGAKAVVVFSLIHYVCVCSLETLESNKPYSLLL